MIMEESMQRKNRNGSVVLDKRGKTWNFYWWEDGKRRSKVLGKFPTKTAAWNAAQSLRDTAKRQPKAAVPTVATLVERYREEKMPQRASTRRGYETWLNNHLVPKWGDCRLTELQARPVEMWLDSLTLAPKSKVHIRGLLHVLWDYAMWRGDIPTARNPMELVRVKNASQRIRKTPSLTVEQFQLLLETVGDDDCLRTMFLLAVSFGLRISEVLGLKWKDIDWLRKTVRIERGVVKQIVDDVKSSCSARTMACADELLDVLKRWRQITQFSDAEDWVFASAYKLGRQPLSYSFVWENLDNAATAAGIGHISSHTFRHTHRTWLDSVGTPVGVQQKLMRHADIRTTMNIYGDAATADMRDAHEKVVRLALRHVERLGKRQVV
jgi:integrase